MNYAEPLESELNQQVEYDMDEQGESSPSISVVLGLLGWSDSDLGSDVLTA